MLQSALILSAVAFGAVDAHMSIWTRSMFGVGWKANGANLDFEYLAGDPVAPLGPGWSQDDYWFRGPQARALPPLPGQITSLPAGGSVTFEIACHGAWTSFGWATTEPGSALDACPGNAGAYHSGDPADDFIDTSMLSGCALGIADTDDISKVTMDNYAIFSVKHDCVKQKMTSFDVPARMPECSSPGGCICGWQWLANNGTANFYMTAFRCNVDGSPIDATPIMPPVDPKYCDPAEHAAGTCTIPAGAKRPLYAYNAATNVVWRGNYDRPGYNGHWGFPNDGAQNDIFMPSIANSTLPQANSTALPSNATAASSSVIAASSVAETSTTVAMSIVAPSTTQATPVATASATTQASSVSTTVTVATSSTTVATSSTTVATPTTMAAPSTTVAAPSTTTVPSTTVTTSTTTTTSVAPTTSVAAPTTTSRTPTTTVVSTTTSRTTTRTTTTTTRGPRTTVATTTTRASTTTTASAAPTPVNLARSANVTVSSFQPNQGGDRAIDNRIGGYPGDWTQEWVSNGEKAGAWLKLTWTKPQTFNRIVLYDRPNQVDWITYATLHGDDPGAAISGGPLNNDGTGFTATFGALTSYSVTFIVNAMSQDSVQAGLAEIQVYYDAPVVATATTARIAARHPRDFSVTEKIGSRCSVAFCAVDAHMSIWTKSMYGVGWKAYGAPNDFQYLAGDPVAPLGPNWDLNNWWFRGPSFRALPPVPGEVTTLPAGGSITLEIACHVAWTSFGSSPTIPGSALDACPGNPGSFHSGDPSRVDPNFISGCALAIADVDDIGGVNFDNYAVFSVQHDCVNKKLTKFDVPARMPKCTSQYGCICGWHWLANNGTANFYMTAFRCTVTGSPIDATPLALPPINPPWCDPAAFKAGTCKIPGGAKRPLFAYNTPTNIEWKGNDDRPGYHGWWGFPNNGAQNDIFRVATLSTTTFSSATPASTSATVSTSVTSAIAVTTSQVPTTSRTSTVTSKTSTAATTSTTTAAATITTVTTTTSSRLAIVVTTTSTTSLAASSSASPKASTTTSSQISSVSTTTVTSSTTSSATKTTSSSSSSKVATSTAVTQPTNLARSARVTVSSYANQQGGDRAIDNRIGGYPGDYTQEWVTNKQTTGAWLKLTWSSPQTFNRVVLYDRVNVRDQITGGTLTAADGSSVQTGALKNDGTATIVDFGTITTTTVMFKVTAVSSTSTNVGLAEIQVFRMPQAVKRARNAARHPRDFTKRGEAGASTRVQDKAVKQSTRAPLDYKSGLTADTLFEDQAES